MSGKRAVFYCSASNLIDPKYNQAARDAVCAACLSGYDIVSGGTVKGTMKVVCDEACKYGVGVIGVLPKFMKGWEYPDVTECIWTDRMSERKDRMREGTDAAIALLDHYVTTGMMTREDRELISFPETIDELKALL